MYFLNPAILFGLTAISIPILIHLLNLRKIRKIEFSTLMFLKEIQKSKMRRIRLKQVILLLLRIGIIVFLVFSFANPVYEGYSGTTDANKRTTLIILDNSFSMNARDNNGQYLAQAKEYVKKILETHKESDEMYLIPISNVGMRNSKLLYDNFKEISDSLNSLKSSYKKFSISEVANLSTKLLSTSKNVEKNIFIISDFQKNNFTFPIASEEFKNLNDNSVHTYLINIGSREINNLSLDSFAVISKILEKDRDVRVKVFLNNHSQFHAKNKIINLYVDGNLKGEKAIDINSFSKEEVEFVFNTAKSGNITGMVEIHSSEFLEDEIIDDNRYYFTLNIPERLDIAFIDDNSLNYNFIELAFKTAAGMITDSSGRRSDMFNLTYEKEITENISRYNVVFIANKKTFSDNEATILKNYVSNGGGLFIFLGNDIDIDNYNRSILSKLNSLAIKNKNFNTANINLKFDKVDFEHPILSEIFRNQNLNITTGTFNIESPRINSYYELLGNSNSRSVITLSNNMPFLMESKFSKGKVIVASVSATNDLSDFPVKNLFAPLMIRSVYYLGNNYEYQQNYITGRTNLVSVLGLKNISSIILPDKRQLEMKRNFSSINENIISLPYSEVTSGIGNYIMEDSLGNKFSIAMNFEPSESNLSKISEEELRDYFDVAGIENITILGNSDDIVKVIQEDRKGIGLWKYFLILAIVFLIAELLYSKKLEKLG